MSNKQKKVADNKPRPQKKQPAKGATGLSFTKRSGKTGLHKRNLHHGRYDFGRLVTALPELSKHVVRNPNGEATIRFNDPIAVKLLNRALLAEYYQVTEWDIPSGYLCPPIPGRSDYIHRLADLLQTDLPQLKLDKVRALDVGVGANCIYPIVGAIQYGWQWVGSDVDNVSVTNVNQIVGANPALNGKVECRLQDNSRNVFKGIIKENEFYHVTTCNPPFHASLQEAQQGTERKIANLKVNKAKRDKMRVDSDLVHQTNSKKASFTELNFGGQKAELWCPGGEAAFVKNMALESAAFSDQVLWFTTLISKKENVRWLRKQLERAGAKEAIVVEMSQGQKTSRFVAWSFKDKVQRRAWLELYS